MKTIHHHLESPVEGSRLYRRKLPVKTKGWAKVKKWVRNVFK